MTLRMTGLMGSLCLLLLSGAFDARAQETLLEIEGSALSSETGEATPVSPRRIETINGKAVFTLAYDDGEPDVRYLTDDSSFSYDTAMRFDLGASAVTVEEISVCLVREAGNDDLDFDLNFWALDGGGGSPGTLLASVPAVVSGGSVGAGTFYSYDLSGFGITLGSGSVYIGTSWDPVPGALFSICGDRDHSPPQPGYSRVNGSTWGTPPAQDAQYGSLMIRGTFDTIETGPCDADFDTLCVQGDRFAVEVDWRKPNGETGIGTAVELTPDTGYFWFFSPSNVEMVVKVLNNCNGSTNRFWVFGGGLTNVQVTMTVTDTMTGAVRTYLNPQMTPFQPIQDTGAFSTCP